MHVTHILLSTPYLKGITVCPLRSILTTILTNDQAASKSNMMGDVALSSVIKMLVFGLCVPETDESPLIPAEIVADAAILVCASPSSLPASRLI